MKVLVTQSCPTLCDPMDCSLPGSSVHGISYARILEWVAALAVAAQARLCWCPAYLYRRPLPPSRGLAARGAPPRARRRETIRVRGGAPSVRKPSLAIREGALGYRTPQSSSHI